MLERTFTVTELKSVWGDTLVTATSEAGDRLDISMEPAIAEMLPLGARITITARFEPKP